MNTIKNIIPSYKRKEFGLDIDVFKEVLAVEGIDAKYRHIYNILFMRSGTIPSSPDIGIDLGNYQWEQLNDNILGKIEEKIKSQVNTYICPGENIIVEVSKYDDNSVENAKKIAIVFKEDNIIKETMKVTNCVGILYNFETTNVNIFKFVL